MKSIFQMIWWKIMTGRTIKIYDINWDNLSEYLYFLNKYVGMQGLSWDWDWKTDHMIIKFRKGKEKYAILCQLKWG
jgi:hypothetical protein